MVGHSNPSIWKAIRCLQNDYAEVETDVYRHSRGEVLPSRQTKTTVTHQKSLQRICEKLRAGMRTVEQFLSAIGHCIRLAK